MRLLTTLILATLLAGCGFHLRRELVLPASLHELRIESADPYSPLARELEQALARSGADFDGEGPAAKLRIPVARVEQLPLSIGANGRVLEYALQYTVEFELVDSAGTTVVPRQSVELERTYQFDSAQALGSPDEQQIVRGELEREMAAAVLRRIEAALR